MEWAWIESAISPITRGFALYGEMFVSGEWNDGPLLARSDG